MYKFKNTLFTHIGLLALIGLITILTPFKGYSQQQQGATAAAPTDVRVVNPANTPVATKIVNTVNEPVPVSGTIKVSNTGSTALNVRSNETRAQAVYQFGEFDFEALIQESPTIYTVPANKRLVIEHVSAGVGLPTDEKLIDFKITIKNQDGSYVGSHYLPVPTEGLRNAFGYMRFSISQPMRLYLDAGMKVSFVVVRNATSADAHAKLHFSGYLISSN